MIVLAVQIFAGAFEMYKWLNTEEPVAAENDTIAENQGKKAENHETSNSTEKQTIPSTSTTDTVVKSNTENVNNAGFLL
ncbi:Hypothetical predicted protein [Mytilus galloprovincialis]|uniref:Uncharacterized protein n=1 Tax=Mytilus galloprovincialis TaxID=29158 RepID=A0A8B6E5M9_MYTGA|nr:Hypothetical predicted protein [Mytilus galloprovincialis]